MVDAAIQRRGQGARAPRSGLRKAMQRKSTIAFLMALPLILLIALLVIYPALYSLHLATLNKSMERFVGLSNFTFLFKRETFWMVVQQSCIFAVTAVIFKALIGFIVAHFVHNIPAKGQRKWRGMLLVPWVIPPAMSTLAWLWLFDPSYSAFNWLLAHVRHRPRRRGPGDTNWARFSRDPGQRLDRCAVLHDHVSGGAQVGARAALRGGRDRRRQLVAAHVVRDAADDAQHHRHHRAVLADRDLRQLRHRAHPHARAARIDKTHVFATWAFWVGIQGGDIPLGACVSLFMVPILAVAATFILRDITRRGSEV